MNSEFDFLIEDDEIEVPNYNRNFYKILIVDDEEDIHHATKIALNSLKFDGIPVSFLSAYNSSETKHILSTTDDIAVILLDVVMESDDSGLLLIDYIRYELNNKNTRIILRTGQPGMALEEEVIVKYDINDYKEKSELTRKKLFTTVYSSLRAYQDIISLINTQNGMKKIIESTGDLFDINERSFQEFITNLLKNLKNIQNETSNSTESLNSLFIHIDHSYKKILSATGTFEGYEKLNANYIDALIEELNLKEVLDSNKNIHATVTENHEMIFMHKSVLDRKSLYFQTLNHFEDNVDLARLYLLNCIIGIDNFFIKRDMLDSQMESLFVLSDTIELRSATTANHVKRVAAQVEIIVKKLGYEFEQINNVKFASMLHDIGKIGIPDNVLLKPGKLNSGEFEIIKTHTQIGYNLLTQSKLPLMADAAEIALYHHECWDGSGYPEGLKEDKIPFSARIVAILDVFDALVNKRVYKEAWTFEDAIAYVIGEKGKKFDPTIVDIFTSEMESIKETYLLYPAHSQS
ncbi:MAG: HD domain-containing protein [Clostridiales bacterium]|nr:HD domain-containing protein [Clostridiales bacterium]